ncbi:MAG: MmgE/PrpD family protein [Bacillota bacterium]|jgi:2-methylcitrate dehydratase PrpD
MDGNDRVAEFIRDIKWNSLPEGVRRRAYLCLLDNLGVTLTGTMTPISRIAAKYASETWRGDAATILLHQCRASVPGAAFANACAGNALDLDDDAIFTRGHPGAQIFPAALAVAEKVGASGQALLEALVVGYEVAIRGGRCWHDHHEIYQACGSWGSLGCAAAAARLLGLNHDQIMHALGIAEYYAPNAPMMRDICNPTMVKHAIGWGAMNGCTSAELAAHGYTGIPSIFGFEQYRDWVMDIGRHYWMTDGVCYKDWSSCAWGHAAAVAVLELLDKHRITADEISHIKVETFEEAMMLYQGYPTTTEEAQFSVKWPLACLVIDGQLGPDQVLEHRLKDPKICALMDKIELVFDPVVDQMYKDTKETDLIMHSAVEITLRDGRHYESGIVERGADRWDEQSLERKFRRLTAHVLEPGKVDYLVKMVWAFEDVPDIRQLVELVN